MAQGRGCRCTGHRAEAAAAHGCGAAEARFESVLVFFEQNQIKRDYLYAGEGSLQNNLKGRTIGSRFPQ